MKNKRVFVAAVLAALSMFIGVTSASAANTSPVSIRVRLDASTFKAGRPIHGVATLTNSSSKAILVEACAIDGWLFVGLANDKVAYQPASPAVACSASIKLKPGVNRFPVTVDTTYQVCQMHGSPQCTKSGMPPLPEGTYHVVVITQGLPKGTHLFGSSLVTLH